MEGLVDKSSDVREPVGCRELIVSVVFVELLPLIAGAVIAAIGYNAYFKQSAPLQGILLLIIGLALLVRNGVVMQFLKICGLCGRQVVHCPLCLFKLDKGHFWRHPMGFDVPVVQCVLPTHRATHHV